MFMCCSQGYLALCLRGIRGSLVNTGLHLRVKRESGLRREIESKAIIQNPEVALISRYLK
jgi:hypothetical protein